MKASVAEAQGYTDRINSLQKQHDAKATEKQDKQSEISAAGKVGDLIKKLKNLIKKEQKIVVSEAIFAGDYKDFIKNKEPFVLMLKYKKPGDKDHTKDYFAFKPSNIKYIAESFALLPVTILKDILSEIDVGDHKASNLAYHAKQYFMSKVRDSISKIKARQVKDLGLTKKNKRKYEKLLNTYDRNLKEFEKAFNDYSKRYANKMSKSSMTDMLPPSKEFKNRYLAVGHSSLCLGVSSNGSDVYQENCKDVESERWTARPLGNGYVQLKSKGLCLKARTADNKNSGQPLGLVQCDKDNIHEQWKIISRDLFFDSVVNRYSQKCLHFDSENANPKTAYATWTSCIGADSQTFRDIADAERPTVHNVEEMVKAKSGSCLSTKKSFDTYFKKNKKRPPDYH